jgi:cytochrome c-type biogenesis protein CcmH
MILEFWMPALGLFVAVAVVLLRALTAPVEGAEVLDGDARIYRDQLDEVARDIAKGAVSPEDGARMRAEVARRLLQADKAREPAAQPAVAGIGPVAAVLGMLIAGALAYVFWIGAPGYPDLPLSERLARADEFYATRASQDTAEAEIGQTGTLPEAPADADLILKLRAAVAGRPDDLQGHRLLAQTEAEIGNLAGARAAFERVVQILGDKATSKDHAALAEMMIAAAGGSVTPQAESELVASLKLDSTNGVARYYSGLMLAQVGRPDQAFALWRPLLESSDPEAPWVAPIRAQIAGLAEAAGVPYDLPALKGPSAADILAAGEMNDDEREGMIRGMVDGLEAKLMQPDAAEAGSVEDWVRLVSSLRVLGEDERGAAALVAGQEALHGDPSGLAALLQAAGTAP